MEFDVQCEDGNRDDVRLLSFDSEVTFLRYRDNGLVMGTSDGMLRIWNTADEALSTLFSETETKLPDPLVELKVIVIGHEGVLWKTVKCGLHTDEFGCSSSENAFSLVVTFASVLTELFGDLLMTGMMGHFQRTQCKDWLD